MNKGIASWNTIKGDEEECTQECTTGRIGVYTGVHKRKDRGVHRRCTRGRIGVYTGKVTGGKRWVSTGMVTGGRIGVYTGVHNREDRGVHRSAREGG